MRIRGEKWETVNSPYRLSEDCRAAKQKWVLPGPSCKTCLLFKNLLLRCFFLCPNYMKECGRAAVISLHITSWTFSLICFNIINNPVLPDLSEFCSRRAGSGGGGKKNCWLIMWPTFSYASGGIFRLSLINILTLKLSNNNENPKLEIIWHKHGHIDAIKKWAITYERKRWKGPSGTLWPRCPNCSLRTPRFGSWRDILHKQCQSKGEGQPGMARSRPSMPGFLFWAHGWFI